MSRLLYGPAGAQVEIAYIKTESVDRVPKYSDDGTEYLWTSITINVQGTVNGNLVPALLGEEPGATMLRLQHYLETPRGQLTYITGTTIYVSSPPAGSKFDANNGPFPRALKITQVGGTQTYMVNYTIETFLVECPGGTTGALFASWRYRITTAMDENLYTTATTSGKIIVRADLGTNPDQLRSIYSPGVPPGFRRISSSYTLQEDGLAVSYDFVDREVYLEPPAPATKASGEYITSTSDSASMTSEVRVRLEAPKTTNKADLIALAILVAQTKMENVGAPAGKGSFIIGAVREELWENVVEVRLRNRVPRPFTCISDMNIDLTAFGSPLPGSLPGTPPYDPGTRGTAGIQLLANLLNDPCIIPTQTSTMTSGFSAPVGEENTLEAQVIIRPVLPDNFNALVSSDSTPGTYTEYHVSSHYQTITGTHELGIASSAPVGGDTVTVQLAARRMILVVDWTAERIGGHPILPDYLSLADSNVVLIDRSDVSPVQMELSADGISIIFKASGRDRYSFKDQSKVDPQYPLAPWMSTAAATTSSLSSDFVQGIIRPAGGGAQLQGGGQPPNNQGF